MHIYYIGDHVCSIFWAIYFGGHQSPTDIVQQMDFNLEITFVSKKSRKKNWIFTVRLTVRVDPPPLQSAYHEFFGVWKKTGVFGPKALF